MSRKPEVNAERLLASVADFAAIGATPAGGVNRQALGVEDRAARRLLAERALARGFIVFQDDIANLFIRREGRDAFLPPLLIGSHLDSQPTGGRFDGALGTLSAFEVLEALADAGIETDPSKSSPLPTRRVVGIRRAAWDPWPSPEWELWRTGKRYTRRMARGWPMSWRQRSQRCPKPRCVR